MKITPFGKEVRKARLDAGKTLLEMASDLKVSSPYLSGLETGRKKVTEEWIDKISNYFNAQGINRTRLAQLADVSNKSINLEGLSPSHQRVLASFARTKPDEQTIQRMKELLDTANTNVEDK